MRTHVYKVTIHREGTYLSKYRFIGRLPTKEELLAAIERRLGESLVCDNLRQADHERSIVSEIGVPIVSGPCTGDTWEIVGIQLGRVQVELEEVWTL